MKEFYIKNKKILNIILVIAISIGFLSLAKTCYAWEVIDAAITSLLGWIAILITKVCGWILLTVIAAVVDIAQYNNFINNPQIKDAWVIIRDLCNMFFILILLIIAFATILRIENYNVKKLLPKLLIMAILINFSRTICGLFIDFSQVIMLTFVNAFADGKGNFVSLLKIQDYLKLAKNQGSWAVDDSINLQSTVAGIIMAVLFMVIATVTMVAILIIFVMRVIMLWIYVILSPLAFLLSAFPGGQKYAGQYWGDFTKYLINGPVLAFFIWLALVTMSSLNVNDFAKTFAGGQVEMLQPTNFMHFIIAIGMLVGGLMVSQQIGGIGASWGANAVNSLKTRGWGVAKGAAKWTGRTAAYLPKEYAKRAGYGAADLALEGLKRAPLISGIAIKKQGELRMKREYAEEKDTRYMKYLPEQDLDRVMSNYTGEGRTRAGRALSFATRGQEASRQGYKRALMEKMQRGEDWGHGAGANRRKTQALIDLARMGGHSVTAEGEDSFRDADIGKLFHEFRNKHVGNIDDNSMRDYYGTVRGGRYTVGPHAGEHASEYFRENDIYDTTGNLIASAGPGMKTYTARRMKETPFRALHHSQLTDDVLDAITINEKGERIESKKLARKYDLESQEDKSAINRWATKTRLGPSPYFLGADRNDPGGKNPNKGDLGVSRVIMGKTKSVEMASGITGLNKLEKGRLALNFADIGLDAKASGKYFKGAEKAEVAARIGDLLKNRGVADNLAKAIEDQINQASHLILRNKGAEISSNESKAAHAHELLHARTSNAFTKEELREVWNSMDEEGVKKAKQKVKDAGWNVADMDDDAVMHEYFTEGLTNKTRWAVKDPEKKITLDSKAEESLENLLKSKGSNIHAFTSNITETRPTKDDVKQTMAGAVDSKLQESMENLANAIENMGDGLDSINKVGGSLGDLEKSIYMNNINLEKNAEAYEDNSSRLNDLTNKIS